MYNAELNFYDGLTDRDLAFLALDSACGKVLYYEELYPQDIFKIAYSYLYDGCKSRSEYEYLVNFLIENPDTREELMKWVIEK